MTVMLKNLRISVKGKIRKSIAHEEEEKEKLKASRQQEKFGRVTLKNEPLIPLELENMGFPSNTEVLSSEGARGRRTASWLPRAEAAEHGGDDPGKARIIHRTWVNINETASASTWMEGNISLKVPLKVPFPLTACEGNLAGRILKTQGLILSPHFPREAAGLPTLLAPVPQLGSEAESCVETASLSDGKLGCVCEMQDYFSIPIHLIIVYHQ
ncbi:uncharacterized protein [Saccopteryx bilineata]|uniref:uncharacterized protein n=1 Tax=Saccopteryx bilineata TaxID=59482 RepID=UPI00338E590A